MSFWILAISGAILAHMVRRLTPFFLGMKENTGLPFRLPLVEVLGAASFVVVAARLGSEPQEWMWLFYCLLLLAVGAADAFTKYIPVMVCYVGTGLGVVLNFIFPDRISNLLAQDHLLQLFSLSIEPAQRTGLLLSLSGAAMGFLLIEFIRRVFRPIVKLEVMGGGDAILMLMIGAFIGPRAVLFSLFPACLMGSAYGMLRLAISKEPHIAFGPALAVGSFVILLFGELMLVGLGAFQDYVRSLPPSALLACSAFLVVILLLLLLRLRRKAAEYGRIMEEDYAETDKKMK